MIHLLKILAMCKACQLAEQNHPHGHKMWAMSFYGDIMRRYNVFAVTGILLDGYDLNLWPGV